MTTEKNVNKFSATSSEIGGTAGNLTMSLKELEKDIKSDKAGKEEYENYMKLLNIRKEELQQRIRENKEWIDTFAGAGGAEEQFKELIDNIKNVYNQAKGHHAKGIEMLIKNFDYHVAYKRPGDTFTATPFVPKWQSSI